MCPNAFENCMSCNPLNGMTGYDVVGRYGAGSYGGFDMDYDGYYNPAMSMNGSLFNYGGYPTIDCGCGGTEGAGNVDGNGTVTYPQYDMWANWERYYDHMFDINDKMDDRNLARQRNYIMKQRHFDGEVQADENGIAGTYNALKRKIAENDQENIPVALENYIKAVKAYYPELTDVQARKRAMAIYAEKAGIAITNDIIKNGKPIFVQKFLNGLSLGFLTNRGSADETVSQIEGTPVARDKRFLGHLGTGFGVGTTAVGTMWAIKVLKPTLKIAKAGKVGAILFLVGTAVGFAADALGLTKKIGNKKQ